jgi:hypothetical protein
MESNQTGAIQNVAGTSTRSPAGIRTKSSNLRGELAARGADVTVAACDVADPASVAAFDRDTVTARIVAMTNRWGSSAD